MGYMKYSAGSGRNEPIEKMVDTKKTGRVLSDLINGDKIDWSNLESNYGIKPKELSSIISGVPSDSPEQMADPRGWSARELYDRMLENSSQYYQTGGVGNSGYSGNQINEMFGPDQEKLAKAMGLPGLPDWSKYDKGSGWSPDYLSSDPVGRALNAHQGEPTYDSVFAANPEAAKAWGITGGGEITQGWNSLDDATREAYRQNSRMSNPGSSGDDSSAVEQFSTDQAIKQLNEKYNLKLKALADRSAETLLNKA